MNPKTVPNGIAPRKESDDAGTAIEPVGPSVARNLPEYGLCIVHYRAPAAVAELVTAAEGWSVRPSKTVVVDNSSDLKGVSQTSVQVVDPGANLGYGAAMNLAFERLRESKIRYALVCTQDACLEDDTAAALIQTVSHDSQCAVAGPLLRYRSRPDRIFSAGGILKPNGIESHRLQGKLAPRRADTCAPKVDWVDGAIMAVDLTASEKVGDFDAEFFLYVEEVDFLYRIRQQGYEVRVVNSSSAYQEPGNYTDFLRYRNHIYFTGKHDNLDPWPWLAIFARDLIRHAVRRIKFNPSEALAGVRAARRGQMGVGDCCTGR